MNTSEFDTPTGNDTLENRLVYWLSMEKWSIDEAAKIICNIMPDKCSVRTNGELSSVTLFTKRQIPELDHDGFPLEEYLEFEDGSGMWAFEDDLIKLTNRFNDIKRLLSRAFGEDEYILPKEAIELITSKNIVIPWKEFASSKNLMPFVNNNISTLNKKDMWVEKARKLGTLYMSAWRKAGFEPTTANIGLYVEGLFINDGTHNTNGNFIDRATIVREALTGITGNTKGHKSNRPKIPKDKVSKLPE